MVFPAVAASSRPANPITAENLRPTVSSMRKAMLIPASDSEREICAPSPLRSVPSTRMHAVSEGANPALRATASTAAPSTGNTSTVARSSSPVWRYPITTRRFAPAAASGSSTSASIPLRFAPCRLQSCTFLTVMSSAMVHPCGAAEPSPRGRTTGLHPGSGKETGPPSAGTMRPSALPPRRGSMSPTWSRIRAIDWLRGLAVLLMIQTHALALLRPELRSGGLFDSLQWVDGLVAPAFILAAGFSMALTQVRAASAPGAAEARRRRMLRTLRRLAEVLLVGILVNWMWFPIFREPRWILRMDILPCIGLSLLLALPILFALAPHPRALRWASLLLAAAVFGVSPLAEPLVPPWNRFLNQHSDAAFPLLPWPGYVYLGAAIGSATAEKGPRGAAGGAGGRGAARRPGSSFEPSLRGAHPPPR